MAEMTDALQVVSKTYKLVVTKTGRIKVIPAGPIGPTGVSTLIPGEAGQENYALVWVGPGPQDYALQEQSGAGVSDHGDLTGLDDPLDHPWAATTDELAAIDTRVGSLETAPPDHATAHVTGGTDVIPNAVSSGASGLFSGSDKAKLDTIEAGATGDETAAEIIAKILTVDGASSGLDADLLDGLQATSFLLASIKGSPLGVAELDINGFVPADQLPSYVDDVLEYADFASLPVTGEDGKIYITIDDGKTWRWGGSVYGEISASLALGETSATAYRGDRGKIAYDHSQLTADNPHNVTKAHVGLSNVDNTSDVNKPVSTDQQTAIDGKVSDAAYDEAAWNDIATIAPSKNAVRDKFEAVITAYTALVAGAVSNDAFAGSWDGITGVAPSKNAVYDKIIAMISDTAYAGSWNGVTDVAPSKNAVYDKFESLAATDIDATPSGELVGVTAQAQLNELDERVSGLVEFSPEYLKDWVFLYDEFMGAGTASGGVGSLGWIAETSNSGAITAAASGQAQVPGFYSIQTGAVSAAGLAFIHGSYQDLSGAPPFICEWRAQLNSLIASGTQEYFIRIGICDGSGAIPSNGYWFEYSISDTSWHARTGKAGTRSDNDTGVVVDTSWHRYRIVCDGGGSITFTIDDTNDVVHSTASSIPTTTEFFGPHASILKSVGTAQRTLRVDYFYLKWGVTR